MDIIASKRQELSDLLKEINMSCPIHILRK